MRPTVMNMDLLILSHLELRYKFTGNLENIIFNFLQNLVFTSFLKLYFIRIKNNININPHTILPNTPALWLTTIGGYDLSLIVLE